MSTLKKLNPGSKIKHQLSIKEFPEKIIDS